MIEVASLKSAVQHTNESQIIELLYAADQAWRKESPMSAEKGLGGTELLPAGNGIIVSKRQSGALQLDVVEPAATVKELARKRGFAWAEGHEDRVINYWASDDRRDRHGDRVNQKWLFDDYADNPIMLETHKWTGLTIGGVIDWAVKQRTQEQWTGDALELKALFATAEQYQTADTIFRLAKAGFMRAGSVGFFPKSVIQIKDKAEREKLNLGPNGFIFDDNALIEWSPCSVPAHPKAGAQLNALREKNLFTAADIQPLRRIAKVTAASEEQAAEVDAELLGMMTLMFPDARIPEAAEEPDVSTKTVVGFTDAQRKGFTEIIEGLMTVVYTDLAEIKQGVLDLREHAGLEPLAIEVDEEEEEEEEEAPGAGDADEEEEDEPAGGKKPAPAFAASLELDEDAVIAAADELL